MKPDPAEVVRGLREQIFTVSPSEVHIDPGPGHQRVWAVVMETGSSQGVATLIAIADGTTSFYFSTGGGVIGAGQHPSVRKASEQLIALVDSQVNSLQITEEHPVPETGRVRFYARTFDDLRTLEGAEKDFGERRLPLSVFFYAGHAVITAIREASPQK